MVTAGIVHLHRAGDFVRHRWQIDCVGGTRVAHGRVKGRERLDARVLGGEQQHPGIAFPPGVGESRVQSFPVDVLDGDFHHDCLLQNKN